MRAVGLRAHCTKSGFDLYENQGYLSVPKQTKWYQKWMAMILGLSQISYVYLLRP